MSIALAKCGLHRVTPEQRRARSYAAQALINDPTLQNAWDDLEAEYAEEWGNCLFFWRRERIWIELQTVRKLRRKLASFAGQSRE